MTIRLPAEGAYLSVLRTATAGLAARLDFTLDEIEDLRIAVDEACGMLLSQAVPGANLECGFTLGRGHMTIAVSVPARSPAARRDTFAWTVLTALAGSVDACVGPRRPADGRAAKDPRAVGVRVTGEIEVAVTEEFETTVADSRGLTVGETDGEVGGH